MCYVQQESPEVCYVCESLGSPGPHQQCAAVQQHGQECPSRGTVALPETQPQGSLPHHRYLPWLQCEALPGLLLDLLPIFCWACKYHLYGVGDRGTVWNFVTCILFVTHIVTCRLMQECFYFWITTLSSFFYSFSFPPGYLLLQQALIRIWRHWRCVNLKIGKLCSPLWRSYSYPVMVLQSQWRHCIFRVFQHKSVFSFFTCFKASRF